MNTVVRSNAEVIETLEKLIASDETPEDEKFVMKELLNVHKNFSSATAAKFDEMACDDTDGPLTIRAMMNTYAFGRLNGHF